MNEIESLQAEIESLQAEIKEYRCALDRANCEKQELAIMYENLRNERAELEKRIEFQLGQIETYKYCIENMRR